MIWGVLQKKLRFETYQPVGTNLGGCYLLLGNYIIKNVNVPTSPNVPTYVGTFRNITFFATHPWSYHCCSTRENRVDGNWSQLEVPPEYLCKNGYLAQKKDLSSSTFVVPIQAPPIMVGNIGWLAILAYISALLKRSQCHWRPGWLIQFSIIWNGQSFLLKITLTVVGKELTEGLRIVLRSRWGKAKFPCVGSLYDYELSHTPRAS